ncbi:lytic murein transglycosylase [Desulfonema ishimotonii]|nr:lytic murein transglycosylase [Desulfonema ishimotonii]
MNRHLQQIRIGLLFLVIIMFSAGTGAGSLWAAQEPFDYFGSLQKRLIRDGFSTARVQALYQNPAITFDTRGVSLYFVHNESKLNYDQFLESGPIRRAKQYMADHKTALTDAEKGYGVSRHVITAIMLVETRLGTYVGNRKVISTLSTMAALEDKAVKTRLWKQLEGETHLSYSAFNTRAGKKSGWAYRELKAFLKYAAREKVNPVNVTGSYAGAMGYCQFMPSNALTLARDGNRDGRIDLFSHADAIMSIANYLNHYGWYAGIGEKEAFQVVYHYNHSKYYVRTVLKIVKRLKG